jgi:hypothetical protein
MYTSESDLVDEFCMLLQSESTPWGTLKYSVEFNFGTGRTDVVAFSESKNIIAFEMKLHDWKKAINQAFRNTSYANESYVVLPKKRAESIAIHESEFLRRSIGLCYIDDEKIKVLICPKFKVPILPWLSNRALSTIE